jgi:GNAT superfamily N-acetyltransferase
VKIKLSFLTEKNLKSLPEWTNFPFSCKYCIYWEFPADFQVKSPNKAENSIKKKLQWLKVVQNDFGNCGIILYIDGKPLAYAQYAPPRFLPNLSHYPVFPSPDSVLISCLFIFKRKYRRQGIGTVLLNAVIEDLEKRNIKTIEAIARKGSPDNPAGPVEFYLKNEFKICKEQGEFALMRMVL